MIAMINDTYRKVSKALDIGFEGSNIPDAMIDKFQRSIFVFSGCKTYHELKEVSMKLLDSNGKIKPFSAFYNDVRGIHEKYHGNYLRAEYDFAISSAQGAAKWADFEKDGVRYSLQYRTAGDEKVRNSHATLNGTTLPASHTFWSEYMPPNGWRCRCNVVQVLRDKYEQSDGETAIELGKRATTRLDSKGRNRDEMFRFNPSKSGTIFPKQHPYFKVTEQIKDVLLGLWDQKGISKAREAFNAFPDKLWEKTYFDKETGGFLVTEKDRIASSKKSKNEMTKYIKERDSALIYAQNGYRIEHLKEVPRVPSPDVRINGKFADLKRLTGHNNIVREAKNAVRNQNAELVLFQFDVETEAIYKELNAVKREGINAYYFFTGRQTDIFKL